MKRAGITVLVLVGVGGLIMLLSFHPKAATLGAAPGTTTTNQAATGSTPVVTPGTPAVAYKDGTYTGTSIGNAYGAVQVQAVVTGGKITQVNLLQMPSDLQHSQMIAAEAGPILQQEAISAQSANVDTVSGATQDSEAFAESLQSALDQAKA